MSAPLPEVSGLIDTDVERALLGAMLADPLLIEPVFDITNPLQFASEQHSTLARAIELVRKDDVVNMVNVATMLRKIGKLEQVGGTEALFEIESQIPVGVLVEDAVSWAEKIRELWQRRALLHETQSLAQLLRTNSVDDAFAAVEGLVTRVEQYRPESVIQIGGWLDELCDPVEQPPPIEWLLTDASTGKGAIPMGKAALYSAGGGTGKTTSLIQLGIAIAIGIPWCGFEVASPGAVVICCGESDEQLFRIHFWKACNAFGLDENQRRIAAHNIYAKPLMGQTVNVIGSGKSGDYQRTPFLTQFRHELEKEAERSKSGFAAVILDPLSRFAGKDTETDNSAATLYVSAVETLCTLPGSPAVINAHHSSKASGQNGRNDARGVSGIVDGFRSNTTLTKFQWESLVGILMSNTKNNLAPHFPDRWLVQQSEKGMGGTLRLATDTEAAALADEFAKKGKKKSSAKAPPTIAELAAVPEPREAILATIKANGGRARSSRWIIENTPGRAAQLHSMVRDMILDGTLSREESGKWRGEIRIGRTTGQLTLSDSRVIPEDGGNQ